MIGPEDGWLGVFTREHAPGAYPNGTRITKAHEEPGDATPLDTPGTILGSLDGLIVEAYSPDGARVRHVYFVEWDTRPRTAIGVTDWKIEPAR